MQAHPPAHPPTNTMPSILQSLTGIPPCPNVTLVGTTESSIYLSWAPIGLLLTTQYVISTDPDINGTINTTATSFRFTDLDPLTDYSINVSACNEVGCNDNCSIVYTTGAILDEDMVSVCSTGGSNPSVTVFVQVNLCCLFAACTV